MNKLISFILCICAVAFTSCGLDPLGKDSESNTSGSGSNNTGGGDHDMSLTVPGDLLGNAHAEDSYVRLFVELRSVKEGGPTYNYANTINLAALSEVDIPEIKNGVYDVYAWADTFTSIKDKTPFYNVENLAAVSFEAASYKGADTSEREAYYVAQKNVTIDGKLLNIEMKHPHAAYEIVVENPYDKFAGATDGLKAEVTYVNFLPSGFNVFNQNINDSVSGVSYSKSLPIITSQTTELSVGKDIVLCGSKASEITLSVKIKDDSGNVCYESESVKVMLENGKLNKVVL